MSLCLVVGAAGLLGNKVYTSWQGGEIVGTSRREVPGFVVLDPLSSDSVEQVLRKYIPSVVVISGSQMTAPDECENHKELVYRVNVGGVANLLGGVKKCVPDAKIVYVSTDFVFSGDKLSNSGMHVEDDVPLPINKYGKSKLFAELVVQYSGLDYVIARVSRLYGYNGELGSHRGFAWSIVKQLENGKIPLEVVANQFGTPTLIDDVANALYLLLKAGVQGVYHVAGPQRLSNFGFAQILSQEFGYGSDVICPISAQEFASKTNQVALRPFDSSLDTSKIQMLGIVMHAPLQGVALMHKQMQRG